MAKLFIPLYFHWLLPIIITVIHLVLITPTDPICSHLVQYPPTFTYIGVVTTALLIDCVLTVAITILSALALRKLEMSRISSGRQLSQSDKQLNVRTVVIMLFNILFTLLFLILTMIGITVTDLSGDIAEIITMFILPIPTIVDPIMYTLSTKAVLPRSP